MDVSGDACSGGFADVHAEVDAVRAVEFAQDGLHALGERHHLGCGFGGQQVEAVEVLVGDDHDVS